VKVTLPPYVLGLPFVATVVDVEMIVGRKCAYSVGGVGPGRQSPEPVTGVVLVGESDQ
jgi:hypothetical protein